ncbi:hypothetical protein D9M71_613300 [compost metagenome]
MIHPCMNRAMAFDGDIFILSHSLTAVSPYCKALVISNHDAFVVFDLFGAVMADEGGFVVVDVDVLVFLRVDVNLFLVLLVLEAQLVESLALVSLALDCHPRLVARKFVGW